MIEACEVAVKSMKELDNIILPFPGGVVRSGSKVGSKYKSLIASTNFEYCPNLKDIVSSKLKQNIKSVLEIVIDGISSIDISIAMKVGIQSIFKKKLKGVIAISAGNYGGKLGHTFSFEGNFKMSLLQLKTKIDISYDLDLKNLNEISFSELNKKKYLLFLLNIIQKNKPLRSF